MGIEKKLICSAVQIETKKSVVRPRTPIIEDPNESRSVSPAPSTSGATPQPSTATTTAAAPSTSLSPNAATTVPKSDSPVPTTSKAVDDEKPKDEKSKDEKPKDEKPKDEKPKEVKSEPTEKKETLKAPEPAGRPVTPTGERGKSKTTGKTISGWL